MSSSLSEELKLRKTDSKIGRDTCVCRELSVETSHLPALYRTPVRENGAALCHNGVVKATRGKTRNVIDESSCVSLLPPR
jgi:hypothetical protein